MPTKKLNIEFVEHKGYYIPKSAVEGFDPDTYFDSPKLDENGLCDKCRPYGYCIEKQEEEKNS